MTIERTFRCDGPDCERGTSGAAHREPGGRFITITGQGPALHFCGWDCVLRFAGTFPPEIVIPADPPSDAETSV